VKISGVFFAIVLLAFLLPFVVVKCGDTKLATFSGYKLVTGGKIETPAMDNMMKGLGNAFDVADQAKTQEEEKEAESQGVKPNAMVIIALLAAIVGLVTAFALDNKKYMAPLLAAVVGFIALLFIKAGMSGDMSGVDKQTADMIKVNLQFGYFLSLLAFIGAAVFAWMAGKNKTVLTKEQVSNIIPDKVENAFDKAKESVTTAGAGLAGKIDEAVDKAKEKLDEANLGDKFDNLVDKAKEKIDEAKLGEKVGDLTDKIKEKVEDVVDKAKDAIGPDEEKKD